MRMGIVDSSRGIWWRTPNLKSSDLVYVEKDAGPDCMTYPMCPRHQIKSVACDAPKNALVAHTRWLKRLLPSPTASPIFPARRHVGRRQSLGLAVLQRLESF